MRGVPGSSILTTTTTTNCDDGDDESHGPDEIDRSGAWPEGDYLVLVVRLASRAVGDGGGG